MKSSVVTCCPPVRLLLLFALTFLLIACEIDTRVTITDAKNPPTFKLSDSGKLGSVGVYGPYARLEDLDSPNTPVRVLWEISTLGYGQDSIRSLPQITYGTLPRGFTQIKPTSGVPAALEEGKFYAISAPSINAGFRVLCFTVDHATVVTATCRER
jgi:hypothetical protein